MRHRLRIGLAIKIALLLILLAGVEARAADDSSPATGPDGQAHLPIPRFVSLKSDKVNVRKGPSTDQSIVWVFSRAGLPVEIIAESDNWRRVRDSEGRRRLGVSRSAQRAAHGADRALVEGA